MGEHTVRLDQFEGPLDLLLHLIRKAELDITEIAIARITDQYLEYVRTLADGTHTLDVDEAGEFLVIAATLVELKSRTISPPDDANERSSSPRERGPTTDPASELIESLLAYQSYRAAADELSDRHAQWSRRYPAGRTLPQREALRDAIRPDAEELDLADIGLYDLVEAFRTIYNTVQLDRLGEHEVEADDTPPELHEADILDQLERAGAVLDLPATEDTHGPTAIAPAQNAAESGGLPLKDVFAGRTRAEMLGLFLALLELVRTKRVAFFSNSSRTGPGRTDAITLWACAAENHDPAVSSREDEQIEHHNHE